MTLATKGSPGYSLVEFLIAMLILALVSLSWLTIVQVQSANRESYRREAVERLAGMMDVISQMGMACKINTSWRFDDGQPIQSSASDDEKIVNPVFNSEESPIGYRLRIKKLKDVSELISRIAENPDEACKLQDSTPVLVGELYEQSGVWNEGYNVIWRAAVVLRII